MLLSFINMITKSINTGCSAKICLDQIRRHFVFFFSGLLLLFISLTWLYADEKATVKPQEQILSEDVNINFKGKWITVRQLDKAARDYLNKKDDKFLVSNPTASVWINQQQNEIPVYLFYKTGFGKMAWKVEFSLEGKIVNYANAVLGE